MLIIIRLVKNFLFAIICNIYVCCVHKSHVGTCFFFPELIINNEQFYHLYTIIDIIKFTLNSSHNYLPSSLF